MPQSAVSVCCGNGILMVTTSSQRDQTTAGRRGGPGPFETVLALRPTACSDMLSKTQLEWGVLLPSQISSSVAESPDCLPENNSLSRVTPSHARGKAGF